MEQDFLLLRKMRRGDETAIECFVRKYYPAVLKYCSLHIWDKHDAEDLAQETFERFFRAFEGYRHLGKAENYLYVIAGNLCRNFYKKKKAAPVSELPEQAEETIPVLEEKMDMERALKQLPYELREVIILRYFKDLKLKQIAKMLDIGLPLVKYRLRRAKELLTAHLKEE
ncbi:RNA polymerase sigma factor [bacterium 210820-DFI.6.37]|nr:RNA polymerase sigma factor [bacterium 210820-DFI.6.37]